VPFRSLAVGRRLCHEPRVRQFAEDAGPLRETAVLVAVVAGARRAVEVADPVVAVERLGEGVAVWRAEPQEVVAVRAVLWRLAVDGDAGRPRRGRQRTVVAGHPELDRETLLDHDPR